LDVQTGGPVTNGAEKKEKKKKSEKTTKKKVSNRVPRVSNSPKKGKSYERVFVKKSKKNDKEIVKYVW